MGRVTHGLLSGVLGLPKADWVVRNMLAANDAVSLLSWRPVRIICKDDLHIAVDLVAVVVAVVLQVVRHPWEDRLGKLGLLDPARLRVWMRAERITLG